MTLANHRFMAAEGEKSGAQAEQTTADRLRSLRQALGITQEALSELCGMTRVEIVQLETGKNKGSSYATRSALAKGVDVPVDALAAFLDGEIQLSALLTLQGSYASTQWWRAVLSHHRPPTHAPPLVMHICSNASSS